MAGRWTALGGFYEKMALEHSMGLGRFEWRVVRRAAHGVEMAKISLLLLRLFPIAGFQAATRIQRLTRRPTMP
jgi:hypothetical protein